MPASGQTLPGCKPFRPAVSEITHIMLIDFKYQRTFDLTCIIKYTDSEMELCRESAVLKNIACN